MMVVGSATNSIQTDSHHCHPQGLLFPLDGSIAILVVAPTGWQRKWCLAFYLFFFCNDAETQQEVI